MLFFRGNERNSRTFLSGTAGSADSVNISFNIFGHVIVYHKSNIFHIESSGRNIGGNKDSDGTFLIVFPFTEVLEFVEDSFSLVLRHIAVNGFGLVLVAFKTFHQHIHHSLGLTENYCFGFVRIKNSAQGP